MAQDFRLDSWPILTTVQCSGELLPFNLIFSSWIHTGMHPTMWGLCGQACGGSHLHDDYDHLVLMSVTIYMAPSLLLEKKFGYPDLEWPPIVLVIFCFALFIIYTFLPSFLRATVLISNVSS